MQNDDIINNVFLKNIASCFLLLIIIGGMISKYLTLRLRKFKIIFLFVLVLCAVMSVVILIRQAKRNLRCKNVRHFKKNFWNID